MAKLKRKLTPAEIKANAKRKAKYMTIFIHGKMKRVRQPVGIEGMSADEFIRNNANSVWLHQNEMWELIPIEADSPSYHSLATDEGIPF